MDLKQTTPFTACYCHGENFRRFHKTLVYSVGHSLCKHVMNAVEEHFFNPQ